MEKTCVTCTHWQKSRPTANWGTCLKIPNGFTDPKTVAYIFPDKGPLDWVATLQTRDTFGCLEHVQIKQV